MNKAWLIESQAALNLLSVWEQIISGQTSWDAHAEEKHEQYEQLQKTFRAKNNVVFAPEHVADLKYFGGFDGASVAIIPINGPLMKGDFCGWFGTARMKELLQQADATPSVQSIVLLIDSPGGTVDGTASFSEAVKKAKKKTYAVVDGMAASAAYWIASASSEIYATSKTDIVGSIGTMVSWWDATKYRQDMGLVLREFTATKSVDKNRSFKEANEGDGRLLVQEMLDPMNNEFLGSVKSNRSGKINTEKEDVFTGKVYTGAKSKDVGLIDGIQSFQATLKQAIKYASDKKTTMSNKKLSFQKTLAASKAEAFTIVTEGDAVETAGFVLSEESLNNIEAAIEAHETDNAQLTQANTDLQATIDANRTAVEAAQQTTLQLQQAQARIIELEKKPAGEFSEAPKEGEDTPAGGGAKKAIHPVTAQLNKQRALLGKAPIE